MVRAMEEEKTAAASGATYVPNAFEFNLSQKDFERLSQISSTLRKELSAVARRAAASEGWRMVGPPEIHIVEDTNFKAGTFGIAAQFVEAATPEPEAGPQTQLIQMSLDADAELVQIGKTSRTWPLSKEAVVIGRMEGCDIILPDAGVSRRHAEIRRVGDEWALMDLGSANGTELNGKSVHHHRLTHCDMTDLDGSRLELWSLDMLEL